MANQHEKPPQVGIDQRIHLPQPNGEEPYPPEHHDATLGIGDHNADDVIEFEKRCAKDCGCAKNTCNRKRSAPEVFGILDRSHVFGVDYGVEDKTVVVKRQGDKVVSMEELTPSQARYLEISKNLGDGTVKLPDDESLREELQAAAESPVHAAAAEILHNNALLKDTGVGLPTDPSVAVDFDEWDDRAKAILEGKIKLPDDCIVEKATLTEQLSQTTNPKDIIGATKPDLSLVPPAAMIYIALAMQDGADKYGPYNWRENPVKARIYIAAAMRHIAAWLDGEEVAADSLKPHIGHGMACLGILADAIETGNLVDDRPLPGSTPELLAYWTKDKKS